MPWRPTPTTRRALALWLAGLLLLTQQLGWQHLAAHLAGGEGIAPARLAAHGIDGGPAAAARAAAGDPADATTPAVDDAGLAADGLCRLCLTLAALGLALLPAALRWRPPRSAPPPLRSASAARVAAAAGVPFQARAPPRRVLGC